MRSQSAFLILQFTSNISKIILPSILKMIKKTICTVTNDTLNKFTQLSQQILPSKAWINPAWDAIHSVTLLFRTDVISAESVDICSTNRAIRLCSALVKSMSWISLQYMKNSTWKLEKAFNWPAVPIKPALPPAWSFGLWLTTSFTINYDEKTTSSFIDGLPMCPERPCLLQTQRERAIRFL